MGATGFITAFQEDVARNFFDLPESEGFLLAGGAALIALGAVERVTDDLDFFAARGEGSVPAVKAAFVARCRARGWETVIIWENDEFVRLSVITADDKVEVDLGIDASLLLPATATFLGPTIGLEENAGRKTLALFGRAAPRDFVDVFNLARRFGKPKLLELAAERDLGFDRGVFGQMARLVNQINARQFPLDEDSVPDLVAFFNEWSEELRIE
jgi:hypothetical protein